MNNNDAGIPTRPLNAIGGGLQHERTALAWERTAIAMMVAGIAFARTTAARGSVFLSSLGIVQTVAGGLLLMWAGKNDELLHGGGAPESVPQVNVARAVGVGTITFTAATLVSALAFVLF